jgi:hypothetical protein
MDVMAIGGDWLVNRFGQFVILTRHFFSRFFQNDVIAFEDQAKEKVIVGIVFLAVLGGHISNSILIKYAFMTEEGPSWVDKCYFLWFFMLLLGFISVLEWDVIFPDRRDYVNIMPLPVRMRTFFLAKFASLFLFIGLYSLAANAAASFIFGFYLSQYRSRSVLFLLRYFAAHFFAASAANMFLFFLCVCLQGLLMSLLSYGVCQKVSLFLRFILLTGFVFLLVFSLSGWITADKSMVNFPAMKEAGDPFLYIFPPLWFTALYERLLGNADPFFRTISRHAVLSLSLAILGFFLVMLASYSRHLKKFLEVKRRSVIVAKNQARLSSAFDAVFLRNPTQRAVFHFFGQTLARSTLHKMRLFGYMSVAMGLTLILLASTPLLSGHLTAVNKTTLSVPLILSFFLLVGIRALVNVPSHLDSNWVFQFTERNPIRHYFAGFKKGIVCFTLIPLFGLLYGFYFYLWGWKPALLHGLFGFTASLLLVEILFFRYPKIPFACSYVPGKAKLHLFWLIYVAGFIAYVSFLSSLERFLFQYGRYFVNYFAVSAALYLAIRVYEDVFFYRRQPIVYYDEPEPVMISLEAPI